MSYTTVRVNETFMFLRLIRKVFDNLDFNDRTNQLSLPPMGDIQKLLSDLTYDGEALMRSTPETINIIMHSNLDSFERGMLVSKLSEFSLKAVFHKLKYRDLRFIENVIENMYHALGRVIDQLRDTLKQTIELLLPLNHVRYSIIEQKVRDMVKMDSMLINHTLEQIKPWKAIAIDYIGNSFELFDHGYEAFAKRYTNMIESLHTLLNYMYHMNDTDNSIDVPPPVLYVKDYLLEEYLETDITITSDTRPAELMTDQPLTPALIQLKIVFMMINDLECFAIESHNKMLDLNEFCEPVDGKRNMGDDEPQHHVCNYDVSYNFADVIH